MGMRAILILVAAVGALLAGPGRRAAGKQDDTLRRFWLDQLDIAKVPSRRKPRLNLSVAGRPLRIGGKEFKRGLGTHARSDLHVRLFKESKRFTAKVGVDDGMKDQKGATVEFVVLGDGKRLWKSGVMRWGDPARAVDVDLSGVEVLTLLVRDVGDGKASDHADWADAKFLVAGRVSAPDSTSGAPMRRAGRDPLAVPVPPELLASTLDPFYKKHVSARGLWIVSSEKVRDAALGEARYLIDKVLEGRDDIRDALVKKRRLYVAVMAHDEMTTDLPEGRHMEKWWDTRARGLGGYPISCAEENLLSFKGDPYRGENILIHEFAHGVHWALRTIDGAFDKRLQALHREAKGTGRFRGYGITNHGEFWAEGVQSWFDCNRGGGLAVARPEGGRPEQINTREQLRKHLPEYAALLEKEFRGNAWTYVHVHERLHQPHLKGYDPSKAPVFKYSKSVIEAARRSARERDAKNRRPKKK